MAEGCGQRDLRLKCASKLAPVQLLLLTFPYPNAPAPDRHFLCQADVARPTVSHLHYSWRASVVRPALHGPVESVIGAVCLETYNVVLVVEGP